MTAAPSSSAPPSTTDTVTSPQPSSSSKPFLTSPNPASSAIRSPMFSSQPLLGKPVNPSAPSSHGGVIFPVGAPSHRGFPVRTTAGVRPGDQLVTVANSSGYLLSTNPMAIMNFAAAMAAASQARPYVYSGIEHSAAATAAAFHATRPTSHQQGQQQAPHFSLPRTGSSKGTSVSAPPKVTSLPAMPSASEHNDLKDRDKNSEDSFAKIHGRKVRLVDGGSGSLYTLCRSWIKNGLTQETHPNVGEGIKLLPKPLPPSIVEDTLNKKVDDKEDKDFQENEHGDSIKQISSQEFLAGHVRRAKKVRARFRRERLLRIERYKQRLSLLLPAPNELGQANPTPSTS